MNGYTIIDSYKGYSLKMSKPDSEDDHGYLVIMDEFPSTSLYVGHGKDVHRFINWYREMIDKYGHIIGLGAVHEEFKTEEGFR